MDKEKEEKLNANIILLAHCLDTFSTSYIHIKLYGKDR